MPTTRRQAAIAEGNHSSPKTSTPSHQGTKPASRKKRDHDTLEEHDQSFKTKTAENKKDDHTGEVPAKKVKTSQEAAEYEQKDRYQTGTIERGHIYFFYRPRVQVDEVKSINDIRNFHILLVPRPPEFAVNNNTSNSSQNGTKEEEPGLSEEAEQKVLAPGADAVPAPGTMNTPKQRYRLITVGKKALPDPDAQHEGTKRKETFFAMVTAVGDDLNELEKSLGEKTYQTKTRGERHEGPVRLVARGGYAIVNSEAKTPSQRETHLGYHVSHPPPAELGDVQKSLGIYSASSFVVQIKNPAAPPMGPQQARSKGAEYPDWIMHDIFGAGDGHSTHSRGRKQYGLRFTSCEIPDLLDYKNADLILIAAREGEEGLETSLGEGRGKALAEVEKQESHKSIKRIFQELGMDLEKFPAESLEGSWI